jgi:ribonuclease HI
MTKTEPSKVLRIFADGGSRGNPGPAAVGVVMLDEKGRKVEEISRYIGVATNNVAEYLAVVYALQEAVFLKAKKLELNLDSQLVARQLKGEYRVKDQDIRKFFDLALNLFKGFDKVEIKEVPREANKEADVLVNKALNLRSLI